MTNQNILGEDGLNKWQRYRLRHLEEYRRIKKEYAKTPEQRKKRSEYMKIWKLNNPERALELARNSYKKHREEILKKNKVYGIEKYGISIEEYNILLKNQNYTCYICNKSVKDNKRLHIDHDHNTGKVRGLLCSRCNGNLGWYELYKINIENYLTNDKMW